MRDKTSEMAMERGKNQSNLVRASFSRALFYDHPFTWERALLYSKILSRWKIS